MSLLLCKHGPVFKHIRKYSTSSALDVFKHSGSAEFLAAAAIASSIPNLHGLPEVIVTGRANVGKSTLFNTVLGRSDLLHTSKKPGRTQTLNFYRVGPPPGKLILVDAPGYGSRGRPEWGALFDHYVATRKELKRVYILFNAKHGLNEVDRVMLESLNEKCQTTGGQGFTLQAVITKVDSLAGEFAPAIRKMQQEIFETAPLCLPAIVTAASKVQVGTDEVRRSIIEACGLGRIGATLIRT